MRSYNKAFGLENTEPKFYHCFVCDNKSNDKEISLLRSQTAFSRISLGEKLQEILGAKYVVLLGPKDRVCWDCATYINWMDRLEHKMELMREHFINQIIVKYRKVQVNLNDLKQEIVEPPPPPVEPPLKRTSLPAPPKQMFLTEVPEENKGKRRKEYTCKFCGKEYVSLVSLTMHVQKVHGVIEVCKECGERFDTRAKLKRHIKQAHPLPEKQLTCVTCGFHTTNTEVYCRHICNSSIVSLTCISCNKRYVDSNFREDNGTYKCQSCHSDEEASQKVNPEAVMAEEESVPSPTALEPEPSESEEITQEDIGDTELDAEIPEFFKDTEIPDARLLKKEGSVSHIRCEGCSEQFKLSDLTNHPCFIRGDGVEYVELETPTSEKQITPTPNLQCKSCNYQFSSTENLRHHWDQTGHLREVHTATVELNKIRDRFKKTEATFKVVKQNFSIRANKPGQNEEVLRSADDFKDMFVRISDIKTDPIEDFVKKDGNMCGTCGISFSSADLLTKHQKNDCLICVTCGISFYDNKLLKKHYLYTGHASKIRISDSPPLDSSSTMFGFKCHRCTKTFQTRFLLRKHFQVHYRGTEKGACQFCLTEFDNKNDIQQHVLEVHGAHLYKCTYCDRTFMSETFRNRHESKHKSVKQYECKICNIKTVGHKSLSLHNETFHQGGSCRLCGKVMEDPIALRKHERRHYFDKELECDLCKKRFRNKTLLLEHSKQHSVEEIKFPCELCPLGFSSETSLKEHGLSHTRLGKFKCQRCFLTFSSRAHFWMHLKTHEACYVCSVCNRSFRDTSLLAVHRRKHWRVRPYQCPQCQRTFSVPATLRRHMHVHTRAYPHRCGICKKGFLTRHAYHRHTETVHAVSNSFPQRRPNIPSLPLNATDEDIFQAADTLIADDTLMFNEYQNKEIEQPSSSTSDLITNEVVVETTELFDEILQ